LVTAARNKEDQVVIKTRILVALVLNLLAGVASAAGLPKYYPEAFEYMGMLQRLNVEQGTAVINGTSFRLSNNLQVHTLDSQFGTVHSLKTRLPVGCKTVRDPTGRRLITEIWLLPKDYSFPAL